MSTGPEIVAPGIPCELLAGAKLGTAIVASAVAVKSAFVVLPKYLLIINVSPLDNIVLSFCKGLVDNYLRMGITNDLEVIQVTDIDIAFGAIAGYLGYSGEIDVNTIRGNKPIVFT